MIAPDKHTDIGTSVPYIAGLALKQIKASGIISYDDLKKYLVKQVGKGMGDNFEFALSFLYLLNRISYNQVSDSFIDNP